MIRPTALFEENFCGLRISSGHTEREVQLRMFASYRSLGLAFLFSFGDKLLHRNRQFKALKRLDGFAGQRGRNRMQNCCGQGEKFAANE